MMSDGEVTIDVTEEDVTPQQPLPALFVNELQKLHTYLHSVNPELIPAELTPAAFLASLRQNAAKVKPDGLQTLQDSLNGAAVEDFLDPETWKGLLFVLQSQMSSQTEPLLERLDALPGGDFVRSMADSLEGAKPSDFLDPETWKGLFFVANYQLQAQLAAWRGESGADDS
jgi:hypothetical protein